MTTDTEVATGKVGTRTWVGPGTWVGQARAFAERYLRTLFRNRAVLFWSVGFPAGFYLLTMALFVDTSGMSPEIAGAVKATVAIGYGVFGAIIVCLNAFSGHLVEDFEADRYEQFRALPLFPTADLAGRMTAGFVFVLFSVGAVLLVGAASGARYALRSPASLPIVLATLAGFAVLWMVAATLVAVAVRDSRYASVIAISVAVVSYFVTGFNGTVVSLFAGDPALLNLLPNTLATRVLTYHLVAIGDWSGAGLAPPGPPSGLAPLGLLAAYGAVCVAVGVVLVRRVIYRRGVSA